jgi:hypothetical protein
MLTAGQLSGNFAIIVAGLAPDTVLMQHYFLSKWLLWDTLPAARGSTKHLAAVLIFGGLEVGRGDHF